MFSIPTCFLFWSHLNLFCWNSWLQKQNCQPINRKMKYLRARTPELDYYQSLCDFHFTVTSRHFHFAPNHFAPNHFAPLPLRPIATSPHPNFPGARESCCWVQHLKITPRFFFKNRGLIVWHKKLCYGTKLAKTNSLTKGCGPGDQGSGGFRFVLSKRLPHARLAELGKSKFTFWGWVYFSANLAFWKLKINWGLKCNTIDVTLFYRPQRLWGLNFVDGLFYTVHVMRGYMEQDCNFFFYRIQLISVMYGNTVWIQLFTIAFPSSSSF